MKEPRFQLESQPTPLSRMNQNSNSTTYSTQYLIRNKKRTQHMTWNRTKNNLITHCIPFSGSTNLTLQSVDIFLQRKCCNYNRPASIRFLLRNDSSTSLNVFFTSFWSNAVVLYILKTRSTRCGAVLWKYSSSNFFFTNLSMKFHCFDQFGTISTDYRKREDDIQE